MLIRGLIFDFNGVLVDDESLHLWAFQQALQQMGLSLNETEYYKKYVVYDDRNFFQNLLRDRGYSTSTEQINSLTVVKSSCYFKAIGEKIPVIQPSVDFLMALPPNLPVAIASGAARKEIEFILGRLELTQRLAGIVASEDVFNGKPNPETFLKALNCLKDRQSGLKPCQVCVIEDSAPSIPSIHSLAMRCIALTTVQTAECLSEADLVLDTLEGWTLQKLEDYFKKKTVKD